MMYASQGIALLLALLAAFGAFGRSSGKAVDLRVNNLNSTRKHLGPLNNPKSQFYYRSNVELVNEMQELANKCGNIMRLYSIGKSSLGLPLWVLEISDKPGQIEAEPSFKYVGNLHGDEPVGRELLLLLGKWLCDNHLKDPLASLIIQGVHLHLLPSMNPDGFELKSRNNANNVDLNRDFPDQFVPQNNDEEARQPETKAVMNWTRNIGFVASASLHGGALVANYPWDGTRDGKTRYSMCDDDKTFQYLAKVYSGSHGRMSQSKEFTGGVTNGAAWYPLYGGMQDWNYIHGKCMDLTLEVTQNKWPLDSELEDIWEENRLSLLMLVASILECGVHGQVVSSSTGLALGAKIHVKGINFTVAARDKHGDYHRLLAPGYEYEVTASVPGYVSCTAKVLVQEGNTTYLDFKLASDETGSLLPEESSHSEVGKETSMQRDLEQQFTYNAEDEKWSFLARNQSKSIFSVQGDFLENLAFRNKQLGTTYGGDVISNLVVSHLKVTSVCLMSGVLVLFLFFLYRTRACIKASRQVVKIGA